MQAVAEILERYRKNAEAQSSERFCSEAERLQQRLDRYNSTQGALGYYDCPDCLNRGIVAVADGNEVKFKTCKCVTARTALKRLEKSGLKNVLDEYTFENYKVTSPWQKAAKDMAQRFVTDFEGNWFFAGGQVGSGKTHLCTAIAGALLKQGKPTRYMLWRDESLYLKSVVMDTEAYGKAMNELKTVEVLYIDDLYKSGDLKGADINLTFELLNYRYINRNLITIISSEKDMDELIAIDEALGSRIYQRTKKYCLILTSKDVCNMRIQ